MIEIAIINESTVYSDADAAKAVDALQIQVTRDFFPLWGIDAHLTFFSKSPALVLRDYWQLIILDDSDQADALGYHDLTAEGLPIGKVFAKSDLLVGSSVSVTISHELLEMLVDPTINLCALDSVAGNLYAYEVCDAVEDDSLGYEINGVKVSDFVLPAWFEGFWKSGQAKVDFGGKISSPFQLASGGYISVLSLSGNAGWTQLTADGKPSMKARGVRGSRRERRTIPMCMRIRSLK